MSKLSKPKLLIDPLPRTMEMIFTPEAQRRLNEIAELIVFQTDRMPAEMVEKFLPETEILIGQTDLPGERLDRAPRLRAIFNVEGNFLANVDYHRCFERGIRVLIASPAFALSVAESALGLGLDLARGISWNDRAFRSGKETYGLDSNHGYRLFAGMKVGIIGFGDLGRTFRPLIQPFRCPVKIYDPWLPEREIRRYDAVPAGLEEVLSWADAIFVFAGVTNENQGFLGRAELSLIRPGGLFVLMSRAAVVDFDALTEAAKSGRVRVATDVFPDEPLDKNHPIRAVEKTVLSAHRSGGMPEAFLEIGDMVLSDLELLLRGLPPVSCKPAQPETVSRFRGKPVAKS